MQRKSIYGLLFFIILLLFGIKSNGQVKERQESENTFRQNEWSAYVEAHSRGFGLGFRYGSYVNIFKKNLYEFQLLNMKHPKQEKIASYYSYYSDSKSYRYGKINDMGICRIGIGRQKVLSDKPKWGGVEIRLQYFLGASLGMIKPVYLSIIEDGNKVIQRYDPTIHNIDNIYGRVNCTYSLDKMSLNPGAYIKLGLNFEYSSWNDGIRAVEVGTVLDGFLNDNQMMYDYDAERFFWTFYINFHLGKKYSTFHKLKKRH